MSIHFMGGRLNAPVEASPNDNGNWDVTVSPGYGQIEVRGDRFDDNFPAAPSQHEFRCWTGNGYDGALDVRTELETHEFRIAHDEEQLSALPDDAWVLTDGSAMRPNDLPDVWIGWGTEHMERYRSWPLVALVPKN